MTKPIVITPDWHVSSKIKAFTTTRVGGNSHGAYDSFNLASDKGDEEAAVVANRALLCESYAMPATPVWLSQVHSTTAIDASLSYAEPPIADASYSLTAGTVCAILTADCLPILICDKNAKMVSAIHAGWRGLAAGIIEATLANLPSDNLVAWLGPAIGPQAFEVGAEVREIFIKADAKAEKAFVAHGSDHWLCDLYSIARARLARLGVKNIYGGQFCTLTQKEQFFSYRRESTTGRMASVIWIDD